MNSVLLAYNFDDFIVFASILSIKDIYSRAPLSTTACQPTFSFCLNFISGIVFFPHILFINFFFFVVVFLNRHGQQCGTYYMHVNPVRLAILASTPTVNLRLFLSLSQTGLTLRCRHFMNQIEPIKNNSIRLCGALTDDTNWFDFAYAFSLRIYFFSLSHDFICFSGFTLSLFRSLYYSTLKFCINKFARQYKTHTNTHNHINCHIHV